MFLTILFGMQEFHKDLKTFFFSIIQKASFPAETGKMATAPKVTKLLTWKLINSVDTTGMSSEILSFLWLKSNLFGVQVLVLLLRRLVGSGLLHLHMIGRDGIGNGPTELIMGPCDLLPRLSKFLSIPTQRASQKIHGAADTRKTTKQKHISSETMPAF